LIAHPWEQNLYAYLSGIIKNLGGHTIEINGMPDHAHILTELDLKTPFPDRMREIKASSSNWIRRHHQPKFAWQRRYGAFTASESAVDSVRRYIRNQKEHHLKQAFEDEYKALLRKHRVRFEDDYLWT
jgi:putative transposase